MRHTSQSKYRGGHAMALQITVALERQGHYNLTPLNSNFLKKRALFSLGVLIPFSKINNIKLSNS